MLKVDDQQGSVFSSVYSVCDSTFFLKSRDAHFIMALSEIGHDVFLFFNTACSSVSLQWPRRLLFNHHFTKVWKNWQGGYFQTINCSPVLTCCLVGLVIEFSFSHFGFLLIGTESFKLLCKSVWKLCATKEATSTATPLCWPNSVQSYLLLPWNITSLSTKCSVCCLVLFSENPFIKYWHF